MCRSRDAYALERCAPRDPEPSYRDKRGLAVHLVRVKSTRMGSESSLQVAPRRDRRRTAAAVIWCASRPHGVSSAHQRLFRRHEQPDSLARKRLDLLGGVLEQPALRLETQLAVPYLARNRRRNPGVVAQVLVQIAGDRSVDVQPGDIEQLQRTNDAELVADAPPDDPVDRFRGRYTLAE